MNTEATEEKEEISQAEETTQSLLDIFGQEYLDNFLEPTYDVREDETVMIKCPCCDSHIMGGGIADALFSTFEWGIAHGEGHCGECRWPIKMYHFLKKEDGSDRRRVVFPMAHRCYKDSDPDKEIDPKEHRQEQLQARADG